MSQTSYNITHAAAYEGTRADSAPIRANAGLNKSAAVIPFGRGVVLDTAVTGLGPNSITPMKLPAAITDKFVGIVLHDMAHESTADGVAIGDMGSILTQGRVYVLCEDAVTQNSPVHLRAIVNGAGTAVGQFRGSADGTNTFAVPNAKFCGSAGAGGIVAIELNLP